MGFMIGYTHHFRYPNSINAKVVLNGRTMSHVIGCNVREGWIHSYVTDEKGLLVTDEKNEPLTVTISGKVEVFDRFTGLPMPEITGKEGK